MGMVLSAVGACLLFILKVVGILLLIILVLAALLLLCPFCADVCWENDTLTVKAGALGITFPVFQYPKPEPPAQPEEPKGFTGRLKAKFRAWRAERKCKKAEKKAAQPAKPKAEKLPRQKAKITLDVVCTMLRGVGTLLRAVFGTIRFTKISVCLGVHGDDPAASACNYGKLQAWLYPTLGVLEDVYKRQAHAGNVELFHCCFSLWSVCPAGGHFISLGSSRSSSSSFSSLPARRSSATQLPMCCASNSREKLFSAALAAATCTRMSTQ